MNLYQNSRNEQVFGPRSKFMIFFQRRAKKTKLICLKQNEILFHFDFYQTLKPESPDHHRFIARNIKNLRKLSGWNEKDSKTQKKRNWNSCYGKNLMMNFFSSAKTSKNFDVIWNWDFFPSFHILSNSIQFYFSFLTQLTLMNDIWERQDYSQFFQ